MGRHGGSKSKRSLRYAGLHASTLRAYRRAISAFLAYANKQSVQMMRSSHSDRSLSEFLDQSFQEGEPISYAGHLLSALKRFHPSLKFKLPEATQFYKNWSKSYHPVRAIPASWELTEALMGVALTSNQSSLGLLIGLGFVAMLRTSEMLALCFQHLVVHRDHRSISLVVPTSKTSAGNPQVVLITDQQLVQLILKLRPRRHLDRPLWPQSGQAFRAAFDRLVTRLGFKSRTYVPYALRRGGSNFPFSGA